jgi:hypothetical protein
MKIEKDFCVNPGGSKLIANARDLKATLRCFLNVCYLRYGERCLINVQQMEIFLKYQHLQPSRSSDEHRHRFSWMLWIFFDGWSTGNYVKLKLIYIAIIDDSLLKRTILHQCLGSVHSLIRLWHKNFQPAAHSGPFRVRASSGIDLAHVELSLFSYSDCGFYLNPVLSKSLQI